MESHGENWYLMFWKDDHKEYSTFKNLLLYKLHPEF